MSSEIMSNEGLRARAQKFMLERDSTTIHWTRNNVAQELAEFAPQIREEDCKAMCDGCAHPESMKVKSAELSPSKKTWVHYFLDGNGHYVCDAATIRNLAEKE